MTHAHLLTGILAAANIGGAAPPSDADTHVHPPSASAPSADTVEATHRIVRELIPYFQPFGPFDPRTDRSFIGKSCLADRGESCYGGDPDRVHCHVNERCHPEGRMADIMASLYAAAKTHPNAGWIVGYTTYTFVRFDRLVEAREIAYGCRSTDAWLCALLEGHVHHAEGALDVAEQRFRAGLELAPDSVRCDFTSAEWVVGGDIRRRLERNPCQERVATSDTIWWLADPLFARPVNDRWVEHVNRVLGARFYLTAWGAQRGTPSQVPTASQHPASTRPREWPFRIPRGVRDSWTFTRPTPHFTSIRAARHHFVPDFEDGDLARPSWRLYAELDDEGYTPPYGTFHELPVQIARFRSPNTPGDSMRVAAAATVVGTELVAARDPVPHLILTDAPESFPVHVTGVFDEHRTSTFLVASAAERYVLSYEVLSDGRYGWHRQMLEPLEETGAGMSDVLLYRPDDPAPPEALEPASALMLGEPAVAQGAELGVFWEAYGAPAGTEVTVELEIEGGGGGFFSRLRSLLPGGGAAPVSLSWSEPSPGEVFPRGVSLGTEGLEPGSYTLVVRIAWEGQDALESTRSLEVR